MQGGTLPSEDAADKQDTPQLQYLLTSWYSVVPQKTYFQLRDCVSQFMVQ
jgi:hypothetical protein